VPIREMQRLIGSSQEGDFCWSVDTGEALTSRSSGYDEKCALLPLDLLSFNYLPQTESPLPIRATVFVEDESSKVQPKER